MRTAVLIVAAGMSSRMGDFKPMLNIGSISVAQRIVATFRQSGIRPIVMVTGYKAIELEKHLASSEIVFLRNEEYASTEMFDSVKIGLEYIKDKYDQILFTPVDIPLFTSDTVQKLMDSGSRLACPVHDGQTGHPILISTQLAEKILSDSGEGGLRGALMRCGVPMEEIEVDDGGVLHDADTPEDYQKLLQFHNAGLVRPVVEVSLAREKTFFDSRIAMLLHLVNETGAVRVACQRMQISYSTGWNLIRNLESQLCLQLITRNQGGAGGSHSSLTEEGKRLLSRFGEFETRLQKQANEMYSEYFGDFFDL